MRSTTAVIAALSTLAAAQVPAQATIWNKCPFDTYVWYVGSNVTPAGTNPADIGFVYESLQSDPVSGGRAIKIFTEEDGLHKGAPHLNLAYNYEDPSVWYELSEVFGSPFEGFRLNVTTRDEACEEFIWENGVQPNMQVCEAKSGFGIVLCEG